MGGTRKNKLYKFRKKKQTKESRDKKLWKRMKQEILVGPEPIVLGKSDKDESK